MEASPFMPNRALAPPPLDTNEPFSPASAAATTPTRRRSLGFRPPAPPLKLSSGETLFRILCPASKTGRVIGKGGANIRQFREETGAKIRIDDSTPGCDERVITIVADSSKRDSDTVEDHSPSAAQLALIRVFERIWKADDVMDCEDKKKEELAPPSGMVVCRLLAPSFMVGCVLGKGGRIIERIRTESGAHIRVFPKDQLPSCATHGDELIQITGNLSVVKRALLSVSGCLQDNSRAELAYSLTPKSSVTPFHGNGMPAPDPYSLPDYATGYQFLSHHSKKIRFSCAEGNSSHCPVHDEEVVFKLLCQNDKVGSLIGKGGSIIRFIENETGASIKVVEPTPGSDERVVIMSSRENFEQRRSPAQEAVIRVQSRIAEIGFEPAAPVVARLLLHPNQVGYLLGDGGMAMSELSRATGVNIRVFPCERSPRFGSKGEEVIQAIGCLQAVQDVLFQLTSRLREALFTPRPYFSPSAPFHSRPEMLPPPYRSWHDPVSPAYRSPAGIPPGYEHSSAHRRPFERSSAFAHGCDPCNPTYMDSIPNSHGNGGHGRDPYLDRPISPQRAPQVSVAEAPDVCGEFSLTNAHVGSGEGASQSSESVVEVVIPKPFLKHVFGEDNTNLGFIRQASGAKVSINELRPGFTEGIFVLSGTRKQTETAQNLIHALILSGQYP